MVAGPNEERNGAVHAASRPPGWWRALLLLLLVRIPSWQRWVLAVTLVSVPFVLALEYRSDQVVATMFWVRYPARWVDFAGLRFRVPRGWMGEATVEPAKMTAGFWRPGVRPDGSLDTISVRKVAINPIPEALIELVTAHPGPAYVRTWSEEVLVGGSPLKVSYAITEEGEFTGKAGPFHGVWFVYWGREKGRAEFTELLQSCRPLK